VPRAAAGREGEVADGTTAELIRVLVVDDHRLFRDGLTALLDGASDTIVVGHAATGAEAIERMEDLEPDVVLMDIMMPDMNGIDATRRIRADHPETQVVMLTMLEDDDSLFAAMCAGAHGYILKGADKAEVLRTVRAVARGEALFGQAIAQRLTDFFDYAKGQGLSVSPFPGLTDREREVLDLIAGGLDNNLISSRLFISSKTVSNHISNIFAKLHLADRSQAIVTAREAGLGRRLRP
jgi:DNA-binding NarL/FixJ family response regulator